MSLRSLFETAAARAGEGAGYAGDVLPDEAWRILSEDVNALLVDVRTQPEWGFVGIPDLGPLGRKPLFVAWQVFPQMAVNPRFTEELAAQGVEAERTVLFMCRSGGRSAMAARAVTGRGFVRAFNIAEGFEGPLDAAKHRGTVAGWKARGLPWIQA